MGRSKEERWGKELNREMEGEAERQTEGNTRKRKMSIVCHFENSEDIKK